MAYVSRALGCQPAPTVPERRCASCGVLACRPDGTPWRNSIRLIAGQRVTVCEACSNRPQERDTVTDYLTTVARKIAAACLDPPTSAGRPCDLALYRVYAVLALAKAPDVTNEDVHHAWTAWQAGVWPEHRSLVPFADLSPAVQEMDAPYRDAINDVGRVARRELRHRPEHSTEGATP